MLSRFFMGWAADKDPEEAANALDELLDEPENEQQEDAEPVSTGPAPAAAPAAPVAQQNDSPELIALLKQVLAKLEGGAAQNNDPLQKLADELAGGGAAPAANPAAPATPEDQESSVTVPAEEMKAGDEEASTLGSAEQPKNPIPGADGALMMLNAVRPYIAKLPENERRAASDAATQAVRQMKGMAKKSASDGYAAIQQAMKQAAAKGKNVASADDSKIGKAIMKKYNPHYKE